VNLRLAIAAAVVTVTALAVPGEAAPPKNLYCTGTVTGGIYRHVFVPEFASCRLVDAAVTGNLEATNTPSVVEVINTPVGHNLMVLGATGHVTVGGRDCQLDPTVGNNLMVKASRNVAICQMTVDNNLMVRDTTGRVMVRDNRVCGHIRVVRNDLIGLRVLRNAHAGHLVLRDNTVTQVRRVEDNLQVPRQVC
jgi:hypothetical protein